MRKLVIHLSPLIAFFFLQKNISAQVNWIPVNGAYAPLPKGVNIYKTTDSLDGKPLLAYYAIAPLEDKSLQFTTDTTFNRRLTPTQFFSKNGQPLLVVNTSFFSFQTHQNLNVVIKKGQVVSYNIQSQPGRGQDTLTHRHFFVGALGISKKRRADIAWTHTDSARKYVYATQSVIPTWRDSIASVSLHKIAHPNMNGQIAKPVFKKWKMQTAVGGGPVLVQNAAVQITNEEELKFTGRAINDQHPRTLMGYTKSNELIIMAIEGRNPGISAGATLLQAARLMLALGCVEAINLDGGGSSCMLINGKETIKPSDKGMERPVPAVFIITASPVKTTGPDARIE